MKQQDLTSKSSLAGNKDSINLPQLQTVFNFLLDHVATASMVTDATHVPQKNVTRFKRKLEKAGRLWEIEKKHCKKTGFRAMYLTTDPDKAPNCTAQLSLF